VKQTFKMAFKSIFSNKGRTFLTMLGIIIGVSAVMILVSVVNGFNTRTKQYYESMGTNRIDVYAYSWNSKNLSDSLYEYCLQLDDLVLGVTPNLSAWGTVRYAARSSDSMDYAPQIYLGSHQYSICNNFELAEGRDLSYLDIEEYNQVCVLGARAKQNFFNYADPIGEEITINGVPFTVVGVYAEKDPDSAWSQDNIIVLPYTMNRILNKSTDMSEFTVKAKDAASTTEAITRLTGFLESLLGDNGSYSVYSMNQWMEQDNSYLRIISLVLGGIAGISLLVGGIGIMNIMLVTVTERTREIGIRKAIGAPRRSIIAQFLIEAAMICLMGGTVGILIGVVGTLILGKLLLQLIIFPSATITIGAFIFSVVLGIIFGLYPAIKASGLQPVVALRAE